MIGLREPPPTAGSPCRRRCSSINRERRQNLNLAARENAEQTETKAPAKVPKSPVAFAALAAGRYRGGEPNLVADRHAVDTLQHKFQIEPQFQLADDDEGRKIAAERKQIAAADLALHEIAQAFEKTFDRAVQIGFEHIASAGRESIRDAAALTCSLFRVEQW